MNSKVYKWCAVPQCTNTSLKTPKKVFVYVPKKKTVRDKWLKAARRDPASIATNSPLYFCEDHFDLPNDMENYMQYHLMGSVSQVRMNPDCLPKKFECQPDRKRQKSDTVEWPYLPKKHRMIAIQKCKKQLEECSTVPERLDMAEASGSSELAKMSRHEEHKVKIENIEASQSFSTKQGMPGGICCRVDGGDCTRHTPHLLDMVVDTAQQGESGNGDGDHSEMCSIIYAKSSRKAEAFDSHANACVSGSTGLWTDDQTYINYYDSIPAAKLEIDEDGVSNNEIEKLKGLMSSYYEYDSDVIIKSEDGSHLIRNRIKYEDEADNYDENVAVKEERDLLLMCNSANINQGDPVVEVGKGVAASKIIKIETSRDNADTVEAIDSVSETGNDLTEVPYEHGNVLPKINHIEATARARTRKTVFVCGKCSICDYKFSNKNNLNPHKQTHIEKKPFACSICDYKCITKSRLKQHIRAHTEEKLFACSRCDYKCSTKTALKLHIRKHTGEKPFICNMCDYKFSNRSNFNRHIKTHTAKKPFACGMCDYKCIAKSRLKQHIRTHTEEKPFVCSICDYKCISKTALKLHIRTHSGEKPFVCNMCDYKFSNKSNLNRHIRTHTGEKPFACNVCHYKYSTKRSLNLHIITHTEDKS